MKKAKFIIISLWMVMLFIGMVSAQDRLQDTIRKSILAGSWYPEDKAELITQIKRFLSNVPPQKKEGRLLSLVVPHAGYMYSGQVAGYAYRVIQDMDWKRVIIIGPSHRGAFNGVSVNIQKAYETPLGIVPVDQEFGKRLIKSNPKIGFIPSVHSIEHSIEIQIPFLQTVLKEISIVPVLMGRQDINTCKALSDALITTMASDGEKTLIIASTDLSHYHDYETAKKMDSIFINDLVRLDVDSLLKHLRDGKCEACGAGAVIAVMLYAKKEGANLAQILNSSNSGDVTGEKGRVVGYCSSAIWIKD